MEWRSHWMRAELMSHNCCPNERRGQTRRAIRRWPKTPEGCNDKTRNAKVAKSCQKPGCRVGQGFSPRKAFKGNTANYPLGFACPFSRAWENIFLLLEVTQCVFTCYKALAH